MRPELAALRLSDLPERWAALGFSVLNGRIWLGGVRLELGAGGRGISSWTLRGVGASAPLDGLATDTELGPPEGRSESHPNGAVGIDHVVVLTPRFERTAEALGRAEMPLRRIRTAPGGYRQGFRRLGPVILELVEAPDQAHGPAHFWGLVVNVSDLDALAERLGDRLGAVKPAVQPERRIATLRDSAGLQEAVAFMSV